MFGEAGKADAGRGFHSRLILGMFITLNHVAESGSDLVCFGDVYRRRKQEEEGIRKAQLELAAAATDSDGDREETLKNKPGKKVKKERRKTPEAKEKTVRAPVGFMVETESLNG